MQYLIEKSNKPSQNIVRNIQNKTFVSIMHNIQ